MKYRNGQRVFIVLKGETKKATVIEYNNENYIVQLLDGSKVVIKESDIVSETY
jgi:sRNA-binding protein